MNQRIDINSLEQSKTKQNCTKENRPEQNRIKTKYIGIEQNRTDKNR